MECGDGGIEEGAYGRVLSGQAERAVRARGYGYPNSILWDVGAVYICIIYEYLGISIKKIQGLSCVVS